VNINSVKNHMRYQRAYQVLDEKYTKDAYDHQVRHSLKIDVSHIDVRKLNHICKSYRDHMWKNQPI